MSEEQIVQEQKPEKKSKCKVLVGLVILSLLLSIASLATSIVALNGGGSSSQGGKVVISKKYDRGRSLGKAIDTNKPIIVFFYTDWCGFCQKFAPTFYKMSKNPQIKKNFAIAYVNCENSDNQKFVDEYGVHGFPTVYVVDKNNKKTQLENSTFFDEDSAQKIAKKALELIGE